MLSPLTPPYRNMASPAPTVPMTAINGPASRPAECGHPMIACASPPEPDFDGLLLADALPLDPDALLPSVPPVVELDPPAAPPVMAGERIEVEAVPAPPAVASTVFVEVPLPIVPAVAAPPLKHAENKIKDIL